MDKSYPLYSMLLDSYPAPVNDPWPVKPDHQPRGGNSITEKQHLFICKLCDKIGVFPDTFAIERFGKFTEALTKTEANILIDIFSGAIAFGEGYE